MATRDFRIVGLPDELRDAVEAAAQADGKSVNEIAIDALKRGLAQRTLDRLKHRADIRRAGKSDEQIEEIICSAISEVRGR
jgi:hypothetical protein